MFQNVEKELLLPSIPILPSSKDLPDLVSKYHFLICFTLERNYYSSIVNLNWNLTSIVMSVVILVIRIISNQWNKVHYLSFVHRYDKLYIWTKCSFWFYI